MDNFREWLSDNLRYIMLIAGILVVLIGLFFGVRAITNHVGHQTKNNFSSDSVISGGAASEADSSVSEAVSEASSTETTSDGGALKENAIPEINTLIQQYFAALGDKDADAVRKLCDTLPEDEANKISSNDQSDYTNITVYTKKGLTSDSYVVYVYYHYKKEGQSKVLPGLSQMLVRKGSDGTYKIVYSDYDQSTSDYIEKLSKEDDVKALVDRVQKEYDSATGNASSSAESSTTATPTPTATPKATATPTPAATPKAAATPRPTSTPRAATPAPTRKPTPAPTRKATPAPTKASSSNGTRQTTVIGTCWVRNKPGYDGTIIGRVNVGDVITVIGDKKDGWYHIKTGTMEGYIGYHFIN